MSETQKSGIDVVIPNWNGRQMLEICLESLVAQSFTDFNIIVVDNGSTDGSTDFVRNNYPQVKIIELSRNYGFSGAVNLGIRHSCQDWVLLLNNDIEMDHHCVEKLTEIIKSEPTQRMFALKMCSFDQRTVLDGAGDGVLRGGVGYRLGTMESDSDKYRLRRNVFGACAGAALYHKSLFHSIGYFDEDFFAYLEDVDFNMRAVRAGFTCGYIPKAVVYHVGSATTGSKINPFTVKLTTRNNIYVICKNFTFLMFLRFFPALLAYQFFWLLFVVKKGQFYSYISGFIASLPKLVAMVKKRRKYEFPGALSVKDFSERIIESERQVIDSIMSRRRAQGKNNKLLRLYLSLFC